MNRNFPGYLITFEGNEGAGKTTIVKDLVEWFRSDFGIEPVTTREPGGTSIGDKIGAILRDSQNDGMEDWTEAYLFQASRTEISAKVLNPALRDGKIVLLDRFRDSTIAYQGYARGLGCGRVDLLNDVSTQSLTPDLTILLDVPVEVGLKRKKKGGILERLDRQDKLFYKDVELAYHTLASFDEENRWVVVDANRDYVEILKDAKLIIGSRLKEGGFIESENLGKERK